MTKDDFRAAIAILGGVADDASTSRLVDYLADRGEPAIVAFAEALARAVFDLDTPTHGAQSVYDSSEDGDGPAIPMSSDVFLHARLAVVASGRDTYERVLADPTAMSGSGRSPRPRACSTSPAALTRPPPACCGTTRPPSAWRPAATRLPGAARPRLSTASGGPG